MTLHKRSVGKYVNMANTVFITSMEMTDSSNKRFVEATVANLINNLRL